MKIILKIIFWLIGLILILLSIGGFAAHDFLLATLCLSIGLFCLPPIREKLFTRKQNKNLGSQKHTALTTFEQGIENKKKISINDVIKVSSESTSSNEMTIRMDLFDENKMIEFVKQNEKEKQNRIKNFQYLPQQVSGSVVQTLESIQIMDTTKNFDTLKGRHQFVEEKIDFLKLASHNKRYLTDVQTGLDQYKTLYYDKVPTQKQIAALLKPNEFNYDEFHCQCILNSFQRFYDEQNKQIATLKRPDSIKNRREKIMDTIREIQNDIPSMANSFSNAHERLEKIYQIIFQETYG